MWRACMGAAAICLVGACHPPSCDGDLSALVRRHTLARGGAEAIEAVRAVQIDIDIEEPTFKVRGYYVATRDGRMRIDIFADGKRVFTEAYDGTRGWQMGEDGAATEASAQGAGALRHGIEFPAKLFGVHELRSRGHSLKLLGDDEMEGVAYHVLGVTLADGYEVRLLLDPRTALVAFDRQRRAQHVDADATERWIETSHEDYRRVAGVLFAFRQVERDMETGRELSRVDVLEMRVNPPIAAKFFEMPLAVAAR